MKKKNQSGGFQDRAYQQEAINFLAESGNAILRAPTGAGKTMMSLMAMRQIGFHRLLILTRRNAGLAAWERELTRLSLPHTIMESWKPSKRKAVWQPDTTAHSLAELACTKIVVVLYASALKDIEWIDHKRAGFDAIIADEAHYFKNPKSNTFKKLMRRLSRERKRIFLSATLQSKGVEDLWSPLHLCAPTAFPSYWTYVKRYCVTEFDGYTERIVGAKKRTLGELSFRAGGYIHNISTRVLKGHVPERVRSRLTLPLPKNIVKIYRSMWDDSLAVLPSGSALLAPGTLAKYTRVRQLLACPAILDASLGVGDGFLAAVDHARDNAEKPHAVIFCDFVGALDIWRAYLKLKLGVPCEILHGGISREEQQLRIDCFARNNKTRESYLLCSTSYAESFDLLSPENAYFVGFNWDQNINYQAEGRLTRGSKTHANFFYVVHKGTVDEHMLDVLDAKVRSTGLVAGDTDTSHDQKDAHNTDTAQPKPLKGEWDAAAQKIREKINR